MKSVTHIVIVALSCLPAHAVSADKMQLDINYLLTRFDAGGNDDFSSNKAITIRHNYFLKDWLATDLGVLTTDQAYDETRQDVVGYYRAGVQTQALMLGMKFRHRAKSPYEAYGRLGLQYWRTELEVEEYFNESIPGGTTTVDDSGYGYYFGIGGAHYITDRLTIQLEYLYMKQLELFADSSSQPFDLGINALSIGVGYQF